MLNYFGRELLDRFSDQSVAPNSSQLMLLNADGYWLRGPSPEDEWGLMFEDRKDRTFANAHPDVWKSVKSDESGRIKTAEGLFTFKTIYPLQEGQSSVKTESGEGSTPGTVQLDAKEYNWKVVSFVPSEILYSTRSNQRTAAIFVLAFLAMITSIGAWRLAKANVLHGQADEELRHHRDDLERLVEDRTNELTRANRQLRIKDHSIASSINGIALTELEGTITYANRAFLDMWGFEREEELVGRSNTELGVSADRIREITESACAEGSWRGEDTARKKDGTPFCIDLAVTVVTDADGAPACLMCSIIDITERKRAAEQNRVIEAELRHAQKMEAVGQLASGVAHEFNNLLAGIRNNNELLIHRSSDILSEQSYAALDRIEAAASRAHVLTNQLLSFARKKILTVTTFDANQCVADCKKMVEKLITADIELNTAVSAEPLFVRADEVEITQVLVNLVLNARDAISESGTITIRTRPMRLSGRDVPANCQSGRYAELSVSDDGCGMSPETSERIFEPFFTTKSVGEGTGLGLSIAYSDIANSGGFMCVESQETAGTVVSVFLPQATQMVTEAHAETETPPIAPLEGDEMILVCDDEELVRDSLKCLLVSFGYSVIAVENAADALAAAESHGQDISLLLTDVTMPGMSGIELGKEIKQRHPTMKVLYSSGYGPDQFEVDDAIEILPKGGSGDEIMQRVRQCLDGNKSLNTGTASDAGPC